MMIHPRTASIVVAFVHLLAPPSARRPNAAKHTAVPWMSSSSCAASSSSTRHVTDVTSSSAMPGAAISRRERKRAQKSRSFRRRQAPITRGQKRTLRELWPKYGLLTDYNARWKFEEIFPTPGAVNFDIGFGSGESLVGMATMRPNENFVGIEVHKPGVAAALARLEAEGLSNVKIVQGDAITVLADHVEDGALSSCCIFFPDPFPQDRDSGRRLVRPLLLSLLSFKLRPGGLLHVATDVEVYAQHTARVVAQENSRWLKTPDFTQEKETQSALSCSLPLQRSTAAAAAASAAPVAAGEEERLGILEERESQWVEEIQIPREIPGEGAHGPQRQRAGREGGSSSMPSCDDVSVHWEGGETAQRPSSRPLTKYEEKAREAGRRVRDFRYRLELPAAKSRPPVVDVY